MSKRPVTKDVEVSFTRSYKMTEKICPVCGKKFLGTGKAKYDTVACQQKANYQRHAEAYRAQKRDRYRAEQQKEKKP